MYEELQLKVANCHTTIHLDNTML